MDDVYGDIFLTNAHPQLINFLMIVIVWGVFYFILMKKRVKFLSKLNEFLLPISCLVFIAWDYWFISVYKVYLPGAPDAGVPNTLFLFRFLVGDYLADSIWSYAPRLSLLGVAILSLMIIAYLQGLTSTVSGSIGFLLFSTTYSSINLYKFEEFLRENADETLSIGSFINGYYINILTMVIILMIGIALAHWTKKRMKF